MIVIDVETTGTNGSKHSLVSIGAIDFSNPSEQFYEECRIWDGAHVEEKALEINGFTHDQVIDSTKQTEAKMMESFLAWVRDRSSVVLMGHNPILDLDFLQEASARAHLDYPLQKRSIDLHSVCFAHMVQKGEPAPIVNKKSTLDSDAVMSYVGIPAEPKPHIALNGALWEAEAFSRLLYNKSLLREFSKYPIPWL